MALRIDIAESQERAAAMRKAEMEGMERDMARLRVDIAGRTAAIKAEIDVRMTAMRQVRVTLCEIFTVYLCR